MNAKKNAGRSRVRGRMEPALLSLKASGATGFDTAWVGMEPTFSNKKAVRKWARMAAEEGGEDAYFEDSYMLRVQRKVARDIHDEYLARRRKKDSACVFDRVKLERGVDQWKVERHNLVFSWSKRSNETFEVRFGLDPETFEFSIKPVPIAWLYEADFVRFLQRFVWDVPRRHGLAPSIAHGGGQFSLSAKTFMRGSLLADDIATRLDHPELSTWIMDYPNPDDRAFRATARRLRAFESVLEAYWRGAFHPRALGVLTVENAFLDRGFAPAFEAPAGSMRDDCGPDGSDRDVFQTNFAFGRAVRLAAQNVHPGYWQSAHPDQDGYRPDQIMRYSEGNLNRLQIAGELHVKSGKVLDKKDSPELDAPLDIDMLYDEASWENRAQMSRTSADDFVEAVLLDVHHAMYLSKHPHVRVRTSLAQDQLMAQGVETLERVAPKVLARLRKEARRSNLEASGGRIKTDWIEPETLFWSVWKHLPLSEQAVIACEAVEGFLARVHEAASEDPRHDKSRDPMEAHRHRVHPVLWKTLERERGILAQRPDVRAEWNAWRRDRKKYLARRPAWSVTDARAPWK
jgi:hypothetical protein